MTARMLAQRQPPFKECVIAHWSSDSAPKMIGTKRGTDAAGLALCGAVGERCMGREASPEGGVERMQVIMQA